MWGDKLFEFRTDKDEESPFAIATAVYLIKFNLYQHQSSFWLNEQISVDHLMKNKKFWGSKIEVGQYEFLCAWLTLNFLVNFLHHNKGLVIHSNKLSHLNLKSLLLFEIKQTKRGTE